MSVVPFVRMLIPCQKVELNDEGADWQYVLTEPLTVIDQPELIDDHSPDSGKRRGVDLSLFVSLTGGLGTTRVLMEVRHSVDDRVYRRLGGTPPAEIHFSTETRGVMTLNLHFSFWNLPMKNSGLYEFRVLALDADDPDKMIELPGDRAEIRVLSPKL